MNRCLTFVLWMFITVLTAMATGRGDTALCPLVKVDIERLPDLNVPRSGHIALCVGKQMVVLGGHTKGFVLIPTAEYYEDGAWHLVPMTYDHDCGTAVLMSSGKVMIAGGMEKNLGIGQTYPVEIYDPETHSFEGMGCLYKKRALASAVEIAGGRVIIVGNWYKEDCVEVFDGDENFDSLAPVTTARAYPYILRTADNDAIVLSQYDNKGGVIHNGIVDGIDGTSMHVPLLYEWTLLEPWERSSGYQSFIGDTAKGEYAYLLSAHDREGQLAFIHVRGKEFSLLPTVCPMPMRSPWEDISWTSRVVADRQARRAYVVGAGESHRLYVLAVDYQRSPATMTLYYTDSLPYGLKEEAMVLTPEGDLLLTGGITKTNFAPLSLAMLIKVGSNQGKAGTPAWLWMAIMLVALVALASLVVTVRVMMRRAKLRQATIAVDDDKLTEKKLGDNQALMQRLDELMQSQQLYRQPDLRLADVARALQVPDRNLSKCIKELMGCSFLQLVSKYRVEYVQQMLTEHPDLKMMTVSQEAGFASEVSFFRTFKAVTGMTPKEWQNSRITDNK